MGGEGLGLDIPVPSQTTKQSVKVPPISTETLLIACPPVSGAFIRATAREPLDASAVYQRPQPGRAASVIVAVVMHALDGDVGPYHRLLYLVALRPLRLQRRDIDLHVIERRMAGDRVFGLDLSPARGAIIFEDANPVPDPD